MTVLVTGGAGYIGSHTCVELLNAGFRVIVADNLVNASAKALERVSEITGKQVKFYEIDVCNDAACDNLFAQNPDIEAVIHFAALKAVGESVAKPLAYYSNNLMGTLSVLKTMKKYGWIDEEALEKQKAMSLERKSDLNYPLTPIVGEDPKQPTNIMFIVIDSWRADTFNADNSPNLWSYAQNGKIFNQHYSTGNATRTGIFGMFYGIPGTYWHGMIVNRQSPVFIDRLQALNYQLGLFAAAKLTNPEFHETAFSKVPNLRIGSSGKVAGGIDEELTQDWLKWYEKRDRNKPTFSFLFYDSPHGYSFPKDYPHQYKPMLDEVNYLKLSNDSDRSLMMNRYKTSVHYVDSIVKQVLDKLKETGDAENTLVIITGDHGQEVNDNLQNFWGHNGNFTDPQVKVPFAIIGPKIQADKLWNNQVLTSHQDIVPTLMKNYLGVTTKIHDYSVGEDLLGPQIQRDWILTSSYSKYGIVTPKNILEVGAVGQFEILDKKNQPMSDQEPNYAHVQAALEQISRFNK